MYHFIDGKIAKLYRRVQFNRERIKRDPLHTASRKDLRVWDFSRRVQVATYWKVLPNGTGCTLLIRIYHREMLKYDFFIDDKSHYHTFPDVGRRVVFPVQDIPDQMDWAFQNLHAHLKDAIVHHPRGNLQNVPLILPQDEMLEVHQELSRLWQERPWDGDQSTKSRGLPKPFHRLKTLWSRLFLPR